MKSIHLSSATVIDHLIKQRHRRARPPQCLAFRLTKIERCKMYRAINFSWEMFTLAPISRTWHYNHKDRVLNTNWHWSRTGWSFMMLQNWESDFLSVCLFYRSIQQLCANCKYLRYLDLSNCITLSDRSCRAIGWGCLFVNDFAQRQRSSLNFIWKWETKGRGVASCFLWYLLSISVTNSSPPPSLSPLISPLPFLFSPLSSLSRVSVLWMCKFKNCLLLFCFVFAFSNGCKSLRYLDMAWCTRVTNRGVSHIPKNCHDLRVLTLTGCREVSEKNETT